MSRIRVARVNLQMIAPQSLPQFLTPGLIVAHGHVLAAIAMHRALQVTELLQLIFSDFNKGCTQFNGGLQGNPTLAALARTCCAFKEPALDALWECIITLDPFLRCLPEDAWHFVDAGVPDYAPKRTPKVMATPSRHFTVADWEILRKYTYRVRKLSEQPFMKLCSAALLELSLGPHDMFPLLPRLKGIHWSDVSKEDISYLPLFLTPTLEDLSISFHRIYGRGVERIEPVLSSLGDLCPDVKYAHIYGYEEADEGAEMLSRSLHHWKTLETVHTGELMDDGIVYLGSLPNLRTMSFTMRPHTSFYNLRSRIIDKPFEALTSLVAELNDLDGLVDFISHMELSLTDIELHVSDTFFCAGRVEDVIKALAKHGTRPLKTFFMIDSDYDGVPAFESKFVVRNHLLAIDSFRPLFKFTHLEILHVNMICCLELNDQGLIELALALPFLRDLSLNAEYGWRTFSKVTFYGLYTVIHLCPRLRSLGIELDALAINSTRPSADLPEHLQNFPEPKANTAITFLVVGDSLIEDPATVAQRLYAVMPKLKKIKAWSTKWAKWDEMDRILMRNMFKPRWAEVQRGLRRLRKPHLAHRGEASDDNDDSDEENEQDDMSID
ncbi:hypothetical protein CONPUDRAFT_143463 [Coniophora puteana RWD-64-598 SS2]|uniref:F-box domain-containing protein n=1 Tax=Coniophora puteana (strain RWD-64-598) TaxID=741705 RepID=A0A5M3MRI3_CONPW|nr:uncharacterized protein CONPUDRAFT_143463 [Coniophora puteana RWD-64-598 SS2]EIW81768.1 hypothetical protein CONPUDRAFT_143463 [Coniophora puteana RWD-64-598 SS2]